MGIRPTSISTPFGGFSWEYTNRTKPKFEPYFVYPKEKLKIYISSISKGYKYKKLRKNLKDTIEKTQLAKAFIFEEEQSATLNAEKQCELELEDSDVCIFFVDNKDGVSDKVQKEVDLVNKYKIKSIFYFCDEKSEEKTALEKSLIGENVVSCRTVHTFNELSECSVQALINDVVSIYHYYCKNRLFFNYDSTDNEINEINVLDNDKTKVPIIPKTMLENIDKCKEYLYKMIIGKDKIKLDNKETATSEIDEWGLQFLPVLFEGKSIRCFNTSLYLDYLKHNQSETYFKIVEKKWAAIQAYFLGDIAKCESILKDALKSAKETNQDKWVINDILIDIRNINWTNSISNNRSPKFDSQEELNKDNESLYYPILDRIYSSIYKKYNEDFYKDKLKSPYVVTYGNNIDAYIGMLSSAYILIIYNGSLTHLLSFYSKIKDFLFYLSELYSDWRFRKELYKYTIYNGKDDEIKNLENRYPEILNLMSADDALDIMNCSNNDPLRFRRVENIFIGLKAVGYYLRDEDFEYYKQRAITEIKNWLIDDKAVVNSGYKIFSCLSGIAHRVEQNVLADICCLFMENHYSRFYINMFDFIDKHIDLNKMSLENAERLIKCINEVMDNEDDRENIKTRFDFIIKLRNQNNKLTKSLNEKVKRYFSDFYNENYLIETDKCNEKEIISFVKNYIKIIDKDNDCQGVNGIYSWRYINYIRTIQNILINTNFDTNLDEIIIKLVNVLSNTILYSSQSIKLKIDAISLLIYIYFSYSQKIKGIEEIYDNLYKKRFDIKDIEYSHFYTNISLITFKVSLNMLYISIGKNSYTELFDLMPYIEENADILVVSDSFLTYLKATEKYSLPKQLELMILQYSLRWIHSNTIGIRWNAVLILIELSKNSENEDIINSQLIKLIDKDNVYIKNLIVNNITNIDNLDLKTIQYIKQKCENDPNYVVRMVYKREEKKINAFEKSREFMSKEEKRK